MAVHTYLSSKQLMQVSLGYEKADLVIQHAQIINVYSGELLDNISIAIKDKWIAYVGPDGTHTIGPNTIIIDATGKVVIPGFIDAHAHISWMYHPEAFLKYVIPGGTTTIITETMEVFPVAGYHGIVEFLNSLKDQPIKFFATAPAMVSISQRSMGIPEPDLKKLLEREDIIGIGESYWQTVLQYPDIFLPCIEMTKQYRKSLEGHSAGAKGAKLQAYCATGISSCHEPIQVDEAIERLRLGMYVMIREGSIRRDLKTLSAIKDSGVDFRRLILVTDGIDPIDLMEKGYMEYLVQKAIDCGFKPISAVQMATLNPAEHFGIDDRVGGIAPGKYADLVIIPDIHTIRAEYVISNGKIIAKNGLALAAPKPYPFSDSARNSVKYIRRLTSSDFCIPCFNTRARVRVMDMITDLVTKEIHMDVTPTNQSILQDVEKDILKIAAIDRTNDPGKMYVGLIHGFGLKKGAIACSAAWDTSCIIVVGTNDSDMAAAVNRIYDLQGGAVICMDGNIEDELALPIFGLISELPIESLAKKLNDISSKAVGVHSKNPLLTLVTLTGAAIPYLRICEEGLVNLKDGQRLSLMIE